LLTPAHLDRHSDHVIIHLTLSGAERMPNTASADRSNVEEVASLVPSLLAIAKLVRAVMAINLSELGLQAGQDEVLLAFEKGRPMSAAQLAEKLGVRPDTASKLLQRLVQQRLAMRVENMIDARSIVVVITASGLELQAQIRKMMAAIDSKLGSAGEIRTVYPQIEQLNLRLTHMLTPHSRA
jgi:DNA-binding MarR family transcriptional regulator